VPCEQLDPNRVAVSLMTLLLLPFVLMLTYVVPADGLEGG
jgi:hypothetical protein